MEEIFLSKINPYTMDIEDEGLPNEEFDADDDSADIPNIDQDELEALTGDE